MNIRCLQRRNEANFSLQKIFLFAVLLPSFGIVCVCVCVAISPPNVSLCTCHSSTVLFSSCLLSVHPTRYHPFAQVCVSPNNRQLTEHPMSRYTKSSSFPAGLSASHYAVALNLVSPLCVSAEVVRLDRSLLLFHQLCKLQELGGHQTDDEQLHVSPHAESNFQFLA